MAFSRPDHTHVSADDRPTLPPPSERVPIPADLLYPESLISYHIAARTVWLALATSGTWMCRSDLVRATGLAQSSVLNATEELCVGGAALWCHDTFDPNRYLFRVADERYVSTRREDEYRHVGGW